VTGALLAAALTLLLPGGRFNAYFTTGFTDAAYQQEAAAQVLKAWKPPKAAPVGKKTVLRAEISRDGKLAGLIDHQMTGDKAWDAAAIAAVRSAVPFKPLPKSWPHPTMEVDFHFEATK
jgi:protein TonB